MPRRKQSKLKRDDTAGIYEVVAAALVVASCIFMFHEMNAFFAFLGDPSYSLVLD